MKVQCPLCGELVEMKEFVTSTQGLRFRCSSCQEENFIEGSQANKFSSPSPHTASSTADSKQNKKVLCPKCGNSQDDPGACHQCGLVFSKFDSTKLPQDPIMARELWEKILQTPQEEVLHFRFLNLCIEIDRIDYASRQYRLLSQNSAFEDLAKQMQRKLVSLVQARVTPLLFAGNPRSDSKRSSRLLFWVVVTITLILMGYFLFTMSETMENMRP